MSAEREKIRLIYREVRECVSLGFLRLVDISTFEVLEAAFRWSSRRARRRGETVTVLVRKKWRSGVPSRQKKLFILSTVHI